MTVPKDLCCNIVFPVPNHPGGMVIHAQMMAAELPCQAGSSVERLHKTQKALQGLRHSTAGLGFVGSTALWAWW
ncbi:unnamed protein product [Allacma fusca]|uniref:Uncharacterized protein n=1 Tax=Allacma fusca TaxID=39272 RepID=A0A8J2LCB7_9HEXA|nr:unnamed protein product [Allacma fusca]